MPVKKFIIVASSVAAAAALMGASCTKTANTNTKASTNTTVTTNTNTTPAVVFNASATNAKILADVNGQWATTATASTEYGSDSWAAKQATGEPNVTAFGDDASAWAPLEKNKGLETLELSYAKAVNVSGLRIRENSGDGTVTGVELKDIDGTYHMILPAPTDSTKGLNYLQIAIPTTTYKVNGVRITFNTTLSPDEWTEIDAVQLVGI